MITSIVHLLAHTHFVIWVSVLLLLFAACTFYMGNSIVLFYYINWLDYCFLYFVLQNLDKEKFFKVFNYILLDRWYHCSGIPIFVFYLPYTYLAGNIIFLLKVIFFCVILLDNTFSLMYLYFSYFNIMYIDGVIGIAKTVLVY